MTAQAADTQRPARPGFATIEAGRGLAALAVVLFHASSSIFPAAKYWNTQVFGRVFDFGYAGVYFFFVLSGFIIAHVHAGDLGHSDRLARYVQRRFVRIYPVYWVILAGLLALLALPFGLSATQGVEPGVLLSSILLAGPDNLATVVAVAWTLYHEILFYAAFGLWIVDRRLGAAVTALWLAGIVAGLVTALPVPVYVVSPLNLLFGFGIAAWWVSRRSPIPAAAPIAVAAVAVFIGLGLEAVHLGSLAAPVREQAFGLACAVGLATIVSIERHRRLAVPRILLMLGAASYSIYLTHFPLLSMFAKIAAKTGVIGRIPAELAFIVVVMLTVAAGYGFHRLVERPLLGRLGRSLRPAKAIVA